VTEFIFLSKVLPSYGLKPGEVETPNIPDAKDRIPSLVAKAIDAAALADPFVAIGEHEGLLRVIDNFCKYDQMPFMLTVTNKILKEQPDAVVAYLRGWLRAVKLLKDEPEKAATVYTDEQKSLGREVPVAVIDKALRRMKWEPDISPAIEGYLKDQAKDLVAGTSEGRIKAVPDLGRALNRDLLAKAKAGR
jgi:ABC-type nitrate/sulfonate/bicarbonate transport system substrate-binding protein